MDKEFRQEIKEFVKDIMEETRSTTEHQFNMIKLQLENTTKQLDNIVKQMDQDRQMRIDLEKDIQKLNLDNAKHYTTCPFKTEMDALKKDVNQVVTSKRFIIGTISLNVVLLSIIATIISIYLNATGKK